MPSEKKKKKRTGPLFHKKKIRTPDEGGCTLTFVIRFRCYSCFRMMDLLQIVLASSLSPSFGAASAIAETSKGFTFASGFKTISVTFHWNLPYLYPLFFLTCNRALYSSFFYQTPSSSFGAPRRELPLGSSPNLPHSLLLKILKFFLSFPQVPRRLTLSVLFPETLYVFFTRTAFP